jgi:hypothetical protein
MAFPQNNDCGSPSQGIGPFCFAWQDLFFIFAIAFNVDPPQFFQLPECYFVAPSFQRTNDALIKPLSEKRKVDLCTGREGSREHGSFKEISVGRTGSD